MRVSDGSPPPASPSGTSTSRSWIHESHPRCTAASHQGTSPMGERAGAPKRSGPADSSSPTISALEAQNRPATSASGTVRSARTNSSGVRRGSNPSTSERSPAQVRRSASSAQTPWRSTSATVHPAQRDGAESSSAPRRPTAAAKRRRWPATAARVAAGSKRNRTLGAWGAARAASTTAGAHVPAPRPGRAVPRPRRHPGSGWRTPGSSPTAGGRRGTVGTARRRRRRRPPGSRWCRGRGGRRRRRGPPLTALATWARPRCSRPGFPAPLPDSHSSQPDSARAVGWAGSWESTVW